MAIKMDEPSGQIVDDGEFPNYPKPSRPPRFSPKDLVVEIITNDLFEVIEGSWEYCEFGCGWDWHWELDGLAVTGPNELIATATKSKLVRRCDNEIQPLPPARQAPPLRANALPPAPGQPAVGQRVRQSLVPPRPREISPPTRLRLEATRRLIGGK